MAKNFSKKRSFYKKKRGKYAVMAKSTTSVPRVWFRPMPAELNIAVTHCQQYNYQVEGGAFARFSISCFSFLGIDDQYPPYFIDLMRIYSTARPRKVSAEVQFISRDNPAEGMNISCGVISNGDIAQLANNQVTMNKIRSVPNSTSHFLGSFQGGHDVTTIKRFVDVDKWMTGGDSITVATRTVYNAGGVVQTVQPEVNSAQAAPGIIFMYTPTQENNFLFQVIRKITYHVTFSGLHLGSQV